MSITKKALMGVAALAQAMGLAMPNAHGVSKANKLTKRKVDRLQIRRSVRTRSPEQQILHSMTNWQFNQWNRAGRPMSMEKLKHFATLPHWKKAKAAA